jgi:hypothetical protein
MPAKFPEQFENVTLLRKANVYYDGQVVSYTVLFKDGNRKRIGVIRPGVFKFRTDDLEKMDITAGTCRVRQSGEGQWETYQAGDTFVAPGWSYFEIAVDKGVVEYVSSFETRLNKKTYADKEYPSVDRP